MTIAARKEFDEARPPAVGTAGAKRSRRRALMFAGPLALMLAGGAWWLMGGRYESTDNAYLHQAHISIAARVGGRVTEVFVRENERLKAGSPLFTVDPVPYRLAFAAAEVKISDARIEVEQLKVAYQQAVAQQQLAQDNVEYQKRELDRQESLGAKGVSAFTALDDARHAELQARDQKLLADQAVANALAALGGRVDIKTDDHPKVKAAFVARDQAKYDLDNATVVAPADGTIYQAASFKAGGMVSPGQSLFALVETGDVWVDANFKETQLAGIAAGQPVDVEFDADPGHRYPATVEAIGAGTGSEFSLLPAQNATGNWVKVTQRVPVRVRLKAAELPPILASGVSAYVRVDTGRHRSLSDLLPASLSGQ